jgi:hypothetical protein
MENLNMDNMQTQEQEGNQNSQMNGGQEEMGKKSGLVTEASKMPLLIVAVVIIGIAVLVAVLYMPVKQRRNIINENQNKDTMPVVEDNVVLTPLQTGDSVVDIESDLDNLNLPDVDAELNQLEQDINQL